MEQPSEVFLHVLLQSEPVLQGLVGVLADEVLFGGEFGFLEFVASGEDEGVGEVWVRVGYFICGFLFVRRWVFVI